MPSEIERKFIPTLREGVDMVKMIFFKDLKNYLQNKFEEEEPVYCGMLAAAVMNELFGTPNPDEKFKSFAHDNSERIRQELANVAHEFKDLCILLTDALRIHFLCNHQEGIEDNNEAILKKAKEYGILIEERDVPLPKGFMELIYTVGKAHGLIVEQTRTS
ncbi:MAG: hypothetical protein KQH63_04045 [Desulfobulbaceae bacterium]|nr:hypothetical protein [Desulfobulbaceae bacterium]